MTDESITPALPVTPAGKVPKREHRRPPPEPQPGPEQADAEAEVDQDEAATDRAKSKRIIDTYA